MVMISLFNIFNIIELVAIIITSVLSIMILREKSSMNEKLLGLVGISVLFDLIAYYLEMNAKDINEALACSKFQLISILFMQTFLLVLVFKLCDLVFKTPFLVIIVIIDIVFGLYFLGFDFTKVYSYSEFVSTGTFPHLVIKEGIVFIISCIFNTMLNIIEIGIIINRARNKGKKISKEYILLLLSFIPPIICMAYRLSPLYFTYNFVPLHISYAVSFGILTIIVFQFRLFDSVQTAKEDIVNGIEDGFIVIDVRKNFLYANKVAYDLIPELSLSNMADNMINRLYRSNKKVLNIGSREFLVVVKPFYDKKMLKGYH